jgi:hypothetical protein
MCGLLHYERFHTLQDLRIASNELDIYQQKDCLMCLLCNTPPALICKSLDW